MSYYAEITVQEAADKIINHQDALILDARDPYSYKESHIDGAMQAHGGLVEHLIGSQDFERPVLVYCYQGNSSKDLAEVFGRAGFKHTYSMKGGYTAWKKRDTLFSTTAYSDSTNSWLQTEGFDKQALNCTAPDMATPLIVACREGKSEIAKELLNAGADLEMADTNGNTAVWAACYSECLPCLTALVAANANLDHQNGDGVTALMYAASAGKFDAVKFLVDNGANTQLKSNDDFSALDLASTEAILRFLKPLN
ncbi:rhodanese-related sulfurtransferase [Alteromonadaceae bacterium 2753L.S.0a.02]|nr:rhodanese-related sulfurtransferase [Alteromonadaceae bacterium 2753L.S.0a.02]